MPQNGHLAGRNPLSAKLGNERREPLELLYGVWSALTQSFDVKEICGKILDSLFWGLNRIDCGHILLGDPRSGKLREIVQRSRNGKGKLPMSYSRTIVNQVFKEGTSIILPDTTLENGAHISDSIENMGVKSLMCAPLIGRLGTMGVIYVHSTDMEQRFQKDDLLFLIALCTPAALAIENAFLYFKSKQAREAVQKAQETLELKVQKRTAELSAANRKLEELSVTDGLTGLYNYRYFIKALDSEYARAIRHSHSLALLLLDIDDFKGVNDNFGHQFGDFVLKNIALLIKRSVRNTDLVARYGGDEIAIILLEADKQSALEVSKNLRKKIEKQSFNSQGNSLSVTVSIGVAVAPEKGIKDWEALLNAADQAMYRAKKAGKNYVVVFRPEN